jgi:glycosyltransferase involved in cell wall biosynthesis
MTALNVVLLIASSRGEMCGVADYTERLAAAIEEIGATVHLELLDRWSFSDIYALRRRYADDPDTVFHMQYPSLHLGKSVAPGFLPLLLPRSFVTLHEFGLFNIIRKLIFALPALWSRRIVFSNEAEKSVFLRYFPFARRLSVLPIGNNIPNLTRGAAGQRHERVVYFGQISRNKGIEFFLDTIKQLRASNVSIEVELIGAMVETDGAFVEMVTRSAAELGVRLRLNMSPADVSGALSEASFALLPFPDGVSNKRGSALACLDHGLTVLTTHSGLTPDWLSRTTHGISTPDGAAELLSALVKGEGERHPASDILARELRARDWHEIARAHVQLYEDGLRR